MTDEDRRDYSARYKEFADMRNRDPFSEPLSAALEDARLAAVAAEMIEQERMYFSPGSGLTLDMVRDAVRKLKAGAPRALDGIQWQKPAPRTVCLGVAVNGGDGRRRDR